MQAFNNYTQFNSEICYNNTTNNNINYYNQNQSLDLFNLNYEFNYENNNQQNATSQDTLSQSTYSYEPKKTTSWKLNEDKQLLSLVQQTKKDWKVISQALHKANVTPMQAKQRYEELTAKHGKKGPRFTFEEDLILAKGIKKYGQKWTIISQEYLPFRTPSEIKNHFHSTIKKKGNLDLLVQKSKDYEAIKGINIEDIVFGDDYEQEESETIAESMSQPDSMIIKNNTNTNCSLTEQNRFMINDLATDIKGIRYELSSLTSKLNQILNSIE